MKERKKKRQKKRKIERKKETNKQIKKKTKKQRKKQSSKKEERGCNNNIHLSLKRSQIGHVHCYMAHSREKVGTGRKNNCIPCASARLPGADLACSSLLARVVRKESARQFQNTHTHKHIYTVFRTE